MPNRYIIINYLLLLNTDILERPKNPKKVKIYYVPVYEVALDNYIHTCTKTCIDCNDDEVGSGFGYWRYEFDSTTTISQVEILPCNDG